MDLCYESEPLMIQLAKMAGMESANIRRMVLVLDVKEIPKLYVESFLMKNVETLTPTKLEVSDTPVTVTEKGEIVEHFKWVYTCCKCGRRHPGLSAPDMCESCRMAVG